MKSMTDGYTFNNGNKIPCIGYGTWKTPDGEVAREVVKQAILAGYRHIDTAAIYKNEVSVGQGIADGLALTGLKREDLFVTSKIWSDKKGYENAKSEIDACLKRLNMDYLDLFLIHWPIGKDEQADDRWRELNNETWRAMEEAQAAGKIRNLGLSNFLPHHIEALECKVKPVSDQLEFHPGCLQEDAVAYCMEHGMVVQAWSPLGSGRVLQDPELNVIAAKYDKCVAQLLVRFCLQYGVNPLPKSLNADRIRLNTQVFDFEISKEDFEAIRQMHQFGRFGHHPDEELAF